MKRIKNLENSTLLLSQLLDLTLDGIHKLEIIVQLKNNLDELKSSLNSEQYLKKFSNIEDKIEKYSKKLTEKTFVEKVIENINSFLNSDFLKK